MLAATVNALTVHTTGVNIDGILANAAAVTVIVGAFFALINRSVRQSIREEIRSEIKAEVLPELAAINATLRRHDSDIAWLKGLEEGRRQIREADG